MKETDDIVELREMLSQIPPKDKGAEWSGYKADNVSNGTIKKILLLQGVTVFLCFSLLISLLLIFLTFRSYFASNPYNTDYQKKDTIVQVTEASPKSAPAKTVSDQPAPSVKIHQVKQSQPAVASKKGERIVVLKEEGGSLYFLALKHYQKANETFFDFILQANPTIHDVRKIDDYQKIILPLITPESYIKKVSDGNYRVHIGTFDTFEMTKVYSNKVSNPEKRFYIEANKFSSKDTWYRLAMGDFNNKKDALQAVHLLEKKGLIHIPAQ